MSTRWMEGPMAIDYLTYEKYSGRTGDPMVRLGEALAGQAARAEERMGRSGGSMGDAIARTEIMARCVGAGITVVTLMVVGWMIMNGV